jgi:hypothetical protein
VELEDEADVAAHFDEIGLAQLRHPASENRDLALLNLAERADEGEQGRLVRTGGTGHHDELAWTYRERVVEQDLIAGVALAE